MILIDLVSSISHALPRLVAAAIQRLPDEETVDPDVGYAFFRPSRLGKRAYVDADELDAWGVLNSTTLGILGMNPIGNAVARMAYRRFGTDVVYPDTETVSAIEFDANARRKSLGEVLAAPVICVVLPWSVDFPALVQMNKLAPMSATSVVVVWKRSHAIERALVYLGQHYAETISLSHLATVACISKFHLVKLFNATLGVTPHRYQVLLRLARAKVMLREGDSITDIAHILGFADHSHLGRCFRILLGMTPTQYQQSVAQ